MAHGDSADPLNKIARCTKSILEKKRKKEYYYTDVNDFHVFVLNFSYHRVVSIDLKWF
jgi:hypothetical protein